MAKQLAIGPHAVAREGIPIKKLPKCDGVYLLCFDTPCVSANGKRITTHYIGFATNIRRRVEHHRDNISGSKFMEYVNSAGVTWVVTHLWLGATRATERQLKRQKHAWRLCPHCNPSLRRAAAAAAELASMQIALPF